MVVLLIFDADIILPKRLVIFGRKIRMCVHKEEKPMRKKKTQAQGLAEL